jgi:hypothetical protein
VVAAVQVQRVLTAPQATSAGTVVQGLLHPLQAARLSEPVVGAVLAQARQEPRPVVAVLGQRQAQEPTARRTPEAGAAQVATAMVVAAAAVL